MKWETRTLQAPKIGRTKKAENGLEIALRCPETPEDMTALAGGSWELACKKFFDAYVVDFQNSENGRNLMKHDGSTDPEILEAAKVHVMEEGRKGGGVSRAVAERRVINRLRSEGKKRVDLDELDRAVEAELEAMKAEKAASDEE